MKTRVILLLSAILLQGCISLTVVAGGGEHPAIGDREERPDRTGESFGIPGSSFPSVVVTPEGGHAVVLPPCGSTSVVVNPDGTHSIAIVDGSTATIVTP